MEATRHQTGCFKSFVIMAGSAIAFIGAIILLADIKCAYDIENWWAPLYPNGETVRIEYDLFRPRALGETYLYMTSIDDFETVQQYYRDKRLATLKEGKTRGLAWSESEEYPLELAIEDAEARHNSLVLKLAEAPSESAETETEAFEDEVKDAKAWQATLIRQLEKGARTLVVFFSACGT